MNYVITSFNYSKHPYEPLITTVVNNKYCGSTDLFIPHTGLTIKQIQDNLSTIGKIITSGSCCVNDFKAHIKLFPIDRSAVHNVYDLCLPKIKVKSKQQLEKIAVSLVDFRPEQWQKLLASVSPVYQYLEDQIIYNGYRRSYPIYSLDTFTGRSKTTGFNIQGTTDGDDIRLSSDDYVFIHFDWIAADARMASHMSQDQNFEESFKTSDPYQWISNYLKAKDLSRDRCKSEFLQAFYSLDVNAPVLDIFPELRQWMRDKIIEMRKIGYLTSIMGRRFYLKDDNDLSVFNSQFQGSVAHAMQAALVKIYERYPNNIITEVHDSIIMYCHQSMVKSVINNVSEIMIDPLCGLVDKAPRMPFKVSIGDKWRKWVRFKEYR